MVCCIVAALLGKSQASHARTVSMRFAHGQKTPGALKNWGKTMRRLRMYLLVVVPWTKNAR
jgi:hypothetical protein